MRQVRRLGYDLREVRHIVLTHLDFDHAGGLDDFPQATVHMMAIERDYDRWMGFERVRALDGVPPEIVMVPLVGHTHGHAGVAVQRGDRWLFQAGDAYFFHAELDADNPRCTPGLRFYQWMMEKDRASRLLNQHRLRELNRSHAREVSIFRGHDILEFERLSGHSARVRADQLAARRSERLGLGV